MSATNAHLLSEPSGTPQNGPSRAELKSRSLGLTSATGLVIGSIIGTGVFTMPAVPASAGTSSLLVLAVVAVGAMLLAVLFGQLTKRVPNSDGGLYAYARHGAKLGQARRAPVRVRSTRSVRNKDFQPNGPWCEPPERPWCRGEGAQGRWS